MMWLKWAVQAIASFVISLLCYVTNPIVVLFANEDGELPCPLSLWQTWDDSVYSQDVVKYKELPSFLLYNYDKHYKQINGGTEEFDKYATDIMREREAELAKVGQSRRYSVCINDDFTFVEKIKRYICGVYWLTRNCSYGFSFWWFGKNANPANMVWYRADEEVKFGKEMLHDTFTYGDSREVCTILGYRIERNWYIGWKIPTGEIGTRRVMIATRFPFVKIKKVGDEM